MSPGELQQVGIARTRIRLGSSGPPLPGRSTGSTPLIAAVLAAEGIFAIALPLVIGPWSDTFQTPIGRRRPFMAAALPPMAFCLLLMAFMPNFWLTALVVFA